MKQTAWQPFWPSSCATAVSRRSEYGSPTELARMPILFMARGDPPSGCEFLAMFLPAGGAAPLHHPLSVPIRAARQPPTVTRANQGIVRVRGRWLFAAVDAAVVWMKVHARGAGPSG